MTKKPARVVQHFAFWLLVAVLSLGLVRLAAPGFLAVSQAFGALFVIALPVAAGGAVSEKRRNKTAGAWLWFASAALFLLPAALLIRGGFESPVPALVGHLLVFGVLAFGALLFLPLKKPGLEERETSSARPDEARSVSRFSLSTVPFALSALLLIAQTAGVFVRDRGFFGVFWGQVLPYAGLSAIVLGAIALRGVQRSGFFRKSRWAAALPGVAAFVIGLVPLFQTPSVVSRADADFEAAFGRAPSAIDGPGFSPAPLDLGALFLGSPAPDVKVEKDIPYLTVTAANGKAYTFRFDHYGLREDGRRPVLIRIHGGAWVLGDKGFANGNFMNYRFAALGCEVFDLQYGLNDAARFEMASLPPGPLSGPFSIDDMVRQLSSFTSFLADRADEYRADTDRVFVSGGSAGGQLALALVLAGASGYRDRHPGIGFDPRLTVRGLVPFYPAVQSDALGIPGDKAIIDTTPLISSRNPPALVYQGGLDGLVAPETVRRYANAYREAGGAGFVLVEFPTAGHGSDLLFWNPYNQVFVYYMERFMALESLGEDGVTRERPRRD